VLADFLDTLLHGATLLGLSLALGGVAWGLWVLRAPMVRVPGSAQARCLRFLEVGGIILGFAQVSLLCVKVLELSDVLGEGVLADLARTSFFRTGVVRALLALGLVAAARSLRHSVIARTRWTILAALAVLLAATGAWLSHAAARMEYRGALMTLTAVHQTAAAIWLGGLVQLGGLWRLAQRDPAVDAQWPAFVLRFSRLALVSVALLAFGAVPLAWTYAGSVRGLFGTGYGSLLVTKGMLLAATLFLAAFNLLAARRAGQRSLPGALRDRLPYLVEAEAIILVMILFATSSLSAQPPPVDVPISEQATVREVIEVFRPKLPSLRTPSLEAMERNRNQPEGENARSREDYLWSNFSHNVAGLILLGISLFALVGFVSGAEWGRHWPLGFVALAVFVFLRASANEGTWPFGTAPVAEVGPEGIQHRIAAVLVLGIGLLEWRARAGPRRSGPLAWIFPILGAVGGILLLAHSHTAFELKSSFLVQVTHSTMGAFAGLMVAARWLELRLHPPAREVAGAAASAAMLAIALILLFYREANVVIPP